MTKEWKNIRERGDSRTLACEPCVERTVAWHGVRQGRGNAEKDRAKKRKRERERDMKMKEMCRCEDMQMIMMMVMMMVRIMMMFFLLFFKNLSPRRSRESAQGFLTATQPCCVASVVFVQLLLLC